MLNKLFLSIAGKGKSEDLNVLLKQLLLSHSLDVNDRATIDYTLKVSEQGSYPSADYYNERGYDSQRITNSLSELKAHILGVIDFYSKEDIIKSAMLHINSSETAGDLASKLADLSKGVRVAGSSLKNFSAEISDDSIVQLQDGQFMLGIGDIDNVTKGVQNGTMAVIAAYTGHGKSTTAVSAIYKNIKDGKKGALFSIEMAPRLVKLQFLIRFMFDTRGVVIPFLSLMNNTLDDKEKALVDSSRAEFNEFIKDKLLILDETVVDKIILSNYQALNQLYSAIESELGGLDFAVWDHANQIDLIFKDLGNTAIRTITSAGKTFQNAKGANLSTLILAQTNREGYKRATKRQGKYDLTALSDLNELERSASYAIFLYTNDAMKLTQETKVCMVKHRLGAEVSEPVTVNFNAPVYVVGEEVEQVQFAGDFSFGADLNDTKLSSDGLDDLQL